MTIRQIAEADHDCPELEGPSVQGEPNGLVLKQNDAVTANDYPPIPAPREEEGAGALTVHEERIEEALHRLLGMFGEPDGWAKDDVDFQRKVLTELYESALPASPVVEEAPRRKDAAVASLLETLKALKPLIWDNGMDKPETDFERAVAAVYSSTEEVIEVRTKESADGK